MSIENLNSMGEQGYELVSITDSSLNYTKSYMYIFKKENIIDPDVMFQFLEAKMKQLKM
jgi:hypothetical protein